MHVHLQTSSTHTQKHRSSANTHLHIHICCPGTDRLSNEDGAVRQRYDKNVEKPGATRTHTRARNLVRTMHTHTHTQTGNTTAEGLRCTCARAPCNIRTNTCVQKETRASARGCTKKQRLRAPTRTNYSPGGGGAVQPEQKPHRRRAVYASVCVCVCVCVFMCATIYRRGH